ncbi:VanW family protein [Lachnospiraceae bacterium ZAX-1]
MKKLKRYLPIFSLIVMVAVVLLAVTAKVNAQAGEDSTIPERVYFGTIAGGGLSKQEAVAAIEQYIDQVSAANITLQAGENKLEVLARDLGLSWSNPEIVEDALGLLKSGNLIARYKAMKDLEHKDKVYNIELKADPQAIATVLENNGETLNTQAVDAKLQRENGAFTVTTGSQGVAVNIEESIKAVEAYFASEWEGASGSVDIVADIVNPKVTSEELAKVKDVLGTFNTSYGGSGVSRSKNVANGASRVDGSLIFPGEEFSTYDKVSPFNAETGYELAGSYENGTTVQTYGGGICQVSTTLYNAAIRAELEITERFSHSMIVGYVDPSADAAIAGTYKNLKFINNTQAPIYIEGYTSGGVIYFTIFGQESRPADRTVEFISETTGTTDPGVQFNVTGDPIGSKSQSQSSHVGKTAKLWKVVSVGGVEQSREVFNNSSYSASPRIVNVGIGSAVPEAAAAVNAAVATQDEGAIDAAIAEWSDAAVAQRQQEAQAAQDALLAQQQLEQEQKEQAEKDKKEKQKEKEKEKEQEQEEDDSKESEEE